MGDRIKIKCGNCDQILAADPAAAGQQVKCPKCQALLMIPKQRKATTEPPPAKRSEPAKPSQRVKESTSRRIEATGPTSANTSANRVVACAGCGAKIKVRPLAKDAVATCPKCSARVRIPATSSVAPSSPAPAHSAPTTSAPTQPTPRQPTPTTSAPARSTPTPAGPKPAAAAVTPAVATTPGSVLDLGQLDVPGASTDPLANPTFRAKQNRASRGGDFLKWVNGHRWVTAIVLLNLITLLCAIIFPPILFISVINIPIGLVIIGLLFVPRQHVVQRVSALFGAQIASLGAGGVMMVILVVLAKTTTKLGAKDNPNVDMSQFLSFSNLGALIGSLTTMAIVVGLFLLLWRFMGIARLLAASYCVELSIMTLLLTIGGIALKGELDKAANDSSSSFGANDSTTRTSPYANGYPGSRPRREPFPGRGNATNRPGAPSRGAAENRGAPERPPSSRDTEAITGSRFPAFPEQNSDGLMPPAKIDPSSPSFEAIQHRVALFRQRNSAEDTVIIRVVRENMDIDPRDVRRTLQTALGIERHFYNVFEDNDALLLFVQEGPISEVVSKLTMGEVISSDEASRTIEFRINNLSQ